MVHLIPLLLLAGKIAARLILARPIPARIGFYTGFAAYCVIWGLFCWSEWRPSHGIANLSVAVITTVAVGAMFGVLYALVVAAVGRIVQLTAKRSQMHE